MAVTPTTTNFPTSNPAAALDVATPASNTAAVITFSAPGAGLAHVVSGVIWSYSTTPTNGNLALTDGGTTIRSFDITAAGPGFIPFTPPMRISANAALVLTLAAGGSGVTGKVNVLGHWVE